MMKSKLIGLAVTSLTAVQATLASRYGRKNVFICGPNLNHLAPDFKSQLRKSKAILVPSVSILKSNKLLLKKCKAPIIIFDSPLNLKKIANLAILDIKALPDFEVLNYKFNYKPFDYQQLFNRIEGKKRSVKIKNRAVNILKLILEVRSTGNFAEPYCHLLYYDTSVVDREKIRAAFYDYFYKHGKLTLLSKDLTSIGFTNKFIVARRKKLIANIYKYLKSDEGKQLYQAIKTKRSAKEIADEFNLPLVDVKMALALNK